MGCSKLLYTLEGHTGSVQSAIFSPDGKSIVTLSEDITAKIWDAQSGSLLHTLDGHKTSGEYSPGLNSVIYGPDDKIVTTAWETAKIWNAKTGKLLNSLEGHTHWIEDASFSADGKSILTSEGKIWDAQTGRVLHNLGRGLYSATYSPDGKSIAAASMDSTAKIWDAQTGRPICTLKGHREFVLKFSYSPDGKRILTNPSYGKIAKIWDAQSGKLLMTFNVNTQMHDGIYGPDGKSILTVSRLTSLDSKIWDVESGKLLLTLNGLGRYSPDGKYFLIADGTTSKIWDVHGGKLLLTLKGRGQYSQDGKRIVTTSEDKTAKIWDAESGKQLQSLGGPADKFWQADYSPDGKNILTTSDDKTVRIWDVQSGRQLQSLVGHTDKIWQAGYSPDGKRILTTSEDKTAKIWDAESGKLINTLGLVDRFGIMNIDWKNKKILTRSGLSISLTDLETGNELLSWVAIDSTDWVVTHPSGLFDASPGAMDKLYFVSNLDIIELNQLKTRYYEPGLWKKIMSGEKLRNVVGFDNVELPPDIRVGQVDSKGNLPIEVINRGGGIGEVTLYINGKEAVKDLRNPGVDIKSPTLSFSVPVNSNKNLVPGFENYLSVKAWNGGQWIESRGTVVTYTPPTKSEIKPAIHVVVCGVSDYTGEEIDLKFAAKDAENMAKALELGAKRLFGTDKSYVYALTTSQKPDRYPTKANILRAFEKISTTASSADVLVVYLSGHGINLGGADGDFYYLTQDAYTASASAYNDPAIKRQSALSSQELVELFKKVPALKQVLMIDACASGKVVDNLMAKRDIESGTLRALDRMKDRTGMHIITGCTADAVSYEASRYGQGVLTYSLLEGLRGLALREEKFVDVNQLFQFAQERVPVLASGIGGIQTPQVFSPNGSQSFDFGELTAEDKKQIPIAKARPIYIRSNFNDEQKIRDVLGLGKKMDEMLNEASAKGEKSPLFFVDVSEYPEGCQLSGLYKQAPAKITLRLNKICEGKESSYNVEAPDEKELMEKIMGLLGH